MLAMPDERAFAWLFGWCSKVRHGAVAYSR